MDKDTGQSIESSTGDVTLEVQGKQEQPTENSRGIRMLQWLVVMGVLALFTYMIARWLINRDTVWPENN